MQIYNKNFLIKNYSVVEMGIEPIQFDDIANSTSLRSFFPFL
jgi:hypothetical protein